MKLIIALIFKIQVFSLVSASSYDFDLNGFQVAVNRFTRAAVKSPCLQPPSTPDKSYTVKLPQKDDISDAKPGEVVPQFTILISKCNEGYAPDYQTDVSTELPSVCTYGTWQPPIVKCKRICKNFSKFSNFNMSCYEYFGGPKISCDGLLLERAIVIPRCQQKFHPDIKVNYDYATCREDGSWDKPFFKCVPDCGQVTTSSISLIADGYPEKRGGAPWNVAIYSTEFKSDEPKFICGGTLINAELAISAAHCFYDEVFHQNLDTRLFHVIVGKATPGYKVQDYPTTKTYRLKNIYFPDTTYKGAVTNYASDIVVLHLAEKVSFSGDVHPACLYLDDRDRFNPGENVKGKLSGFGTTRNDSEATRLYSAELPYVSYGECLKKVREDFLGSFSVDKFCAGSENGPGARSGDSGGGLLFMDKVTGLYYLRGIVSNKDLSGSSIATFTDVAQYMAWIVKLIETIERKSECSCNPNGSVNRGDCDSNSGRCQCKPFVTGKDCDTCKDGFWKLRADNPDGCMTCGCNAAGSYSSRCDKSSGSCLCKPNVIGKQCDECTDSTKVMGSNGCEDGPKWVRYAKGEKCQNAIIGGYRTPMNETLYIARHQINENLLPGKLVPSQKSAFIPLFLREHVFAEYEVLCGGLTEWVKAKNGDIPRKAVAGGLGYGDIGAETMYVCRAVADDGSIVPGKLHPSKKTCFIPNGGKEHFRLQYEVLVQHNPTACECDTIGSVFPICEGTSTSCKCKPNVIGKNCDRCAPDTYDFGPQGCKIGPKWLKYSKGEKCSDAIVGGNRTPMNETLYIARRQINENLLLGKLVPSQKLAFIPLFLGEHSFPDYEVLCGGSTKWVAASQGVIPKGAFGGGVGYGDIGQEIMYVCRAKASDGSVVPGKLHPSKKVCYIPNGGKEHPIGNYEVLVV